MFYKYEIKIRGGDVFNHADTGLFHVVDNICKQKQAEDKCSFPHNVLTKEDIFSLYDSEALSNKTPLGFLNRMIFNLAISTTCRPGMLYNLEAQDVRLEKPKGEEVYRIISFIATPNASKCEKGVLLL